MNGKNWTCNKGINICDIIAVELVYDKLFKTFLSMKKDNYYNLLCNIIESLYNKIKSSNL